MVRVTYALVTAEVGAAVLTSSYTATWFLHLLQIPVFAAATVWLVCSIARPFPLTFSAVMLPLAGAVAWGACQMAAGWTAVPAATRFSVLTWAWYLALFWLSLEVFRTDSARRSLRRRLVYFGFALAVVSTSQFYTSHGKVFWLFPTPYQDSVMGPFVNRNHYAAFAELLLPAAVYEALRAARRQAAFALIAAVLFASIIATGSRAGAILGTAEILLVAAITPPAAREASLPAPPKRWRTLAAIGVLAVIFSAVAGWELLWKRLSDPDPYRYRREMLASSLEMFANRSWTGFGLGTFAAVYPAYARFDGGFRIEHAHNDWAEWAAEGGIPFLLLLAGAAVAACWLWRRAPWGAGVVAIFLHALVDFPLQKPALAACAFVLLGAMAARGSRTPQRCR